MNMHISKIFLSNFRNYEEQAFEFSPQVNCIVGDNGSGKTNLIDAIYFLALTKSSLHNHDLLSIKHEEDYMLFEGLFEDKNQTDRITISMQRGLKKNVLTNKQPYERISDHIGKYPVVLIAPDDTDLIRDGSETRRRLFDGIISQFDNNYLADYQKYNRLLEQRNSLLKQFSERQYFDQALLDIYSEPLLETGLSLHQQRFDFLQKFLPIVKQHYDQISEHKENIEIVYNSELGDPRFREIFKANEFADRQAQRTLKGIHKDDFLFEFNEFPLKKFGSQGQKKSFIMALRLAQFDLLEKEKGKKPILLLDDIFDKLDDHRIHQLIESIAQGKFGQVFITDARPERSEKLVQKLTQEVKFIKTC